MTTPLRYGWTRNFARTEGRLKSQYPALADTIDRHLWYGDVMSHEDVAGMEDLPVAVNRSYWSPPPEMQALIRANVVRHLADWRADPKTTPLRLRRKKAEESYAALNELPTAYPEELSDYMNDRTVRLSRMTPDGLEIQQACYLDQLGSNILCDQDISGVTARSFDRAGDGGLRPLHDSALANTVGVACIFVGCDQIPVLRFRQQEAEGERMAIMQNGWHCTSSGVLKFDDVIDLRDPSRGYTLRDFRRGLLREATYEPGLWDHEDLYDCTLVGFARELKRAGKPQFFYRVQFKTMTAQEIVDEMRTRYQREGDEYAPQADRRILGRFIDRLRTPKPGELRDVLIEPRYALDRLTRADLTAMAESQENRMTFECFANLWVMVGEARP